MGLARFTQQEDRRTIKELRQRLAIIHRIANGESSHVSDTGRLASIHRVSNTRRKMTRLELAAWSTK